jgi:hypothetical protein
MMKAFLVAALASLAMALAACGGGTNADPVTPTAPPPDNPPPSSGPSSSALIDVALAKGDIDADTALKFKVLAMFNDARLPTQFKGDDSGVFETNALQELNARFDTLSSDNQAALGAFLLRPSSKGSWANPATASASASSRMSALARPVCDGDAPGWGKFSTTNLKANVWYRTGVPDDFNRARVVAEAIDQRIWPTLITTVGFKEPVGDTPIFMCDGGDSRLDVYFVRKVNFRGLTQAEQTELANVPTYIMLNTDRLSDDNALRAGITHEIMHAIQWAYPMKSDHESYGWMHDAMANWAVDQVYGTTIQLEQQYADCFTSTPELPLDDRSTGHCLTQTKNVERDYGAYLFFQFIARTHGAPMVEKVLSATFDYPTSLEAVEKTIPGGFKEQWPKFAKTLWNQAPIDTRPASFRQWDALTETPRKSPNGVDLNGNLNGETNPFKLTNELNNLSSRYYHFTFNDPNTRSILFYNGFFDQIKAGKSLKIFAIWRDASGNWQEEPLDDPAQRSEDWSKYKYVGLCRDIKAQGASELTIIITNAEKEPGGKVTTSTEPSLKRSNVGCFKYEGTASSTFKDTAVPWRGQGAKIVSSKLTFEIDPERRTLDAKNPTIPDSLRVGLGLPMRLTDASFTYEDSHDLYACSFVLLQTTFNFQDGLTIGFMYASPYDSLDKIVSIDEQTQIALAGPTGNYFGFALDLRPQVLATTKECASEALKQSVGGIFATGDGTGGMLPRVDPNGTMQGNFVTAKGTSTWMLLPKSEP